jgi:hypothetical protein
MNELEKLQLQPSLFGIKYKFVWVSVTYDNGEVQYRNFQYGTIKSFIQIEFVDGKKYRIISKYNWRYLNDNVWQAYFLKYGRKLYLKMTLPILISLVSLRITCSNQQDDIAFRAKQERQKEVLDSVLMATNHLFLQRSDSVDMKFQAITSKMDSLAVKVQK